MKLYGLSTEYADVEMPVDKSGRPITFTWEQVNAIWKYVSIWKKIYFKEKKQLPEFNEANMAKSCLMGRMMMEGLPPLKDAPPVVLSAPAYHLVDELFCQFCGGRRDDPGRTVSLEAGAHTKYFMDPVDAVKGKWITKIVCGMEWHPKGK